jgi:hypothetical protein
LLALTIKFFIRKVLPTPQYPYPLTPLDQQE